MKRTSAELKRIARENLRGHYALPMGAMVVASLITGAVLSPFSMIYTFNQTSSSLVIYQIANIIISLVSIILSSGLLRIHLKLARKETPVFSDLFYCFTRRPDRFLLSGLLLVVISIVCMLPGIICIILFALFEAYIMIFLSVLLILGGTVLTIIVSLQLGLVFLLLTDHDSMGVMEAFRTSYRMMSGNKGRMFYISLSFIGWMLLCMLSCFIGYLWLAPYITQTSVEFYRDVKGELDAPLPNNDSDDIIF